MKRSLARRVHRAAGVTWSPRNLARGMSPHGQVTVVLTFPDAAFPGLPEWHPGPGFEMTSEDNAWRRDNPDGTTTAVVTYVGDSEHPEVWTATARSSAWYFSSIDMWDKPHRIRSLVRDPEPGVVVARVPQAGHPSAEVEAYWTEFKREWGFSPVRMAGGYYPYRSRCRWVALHTGGWQSALPGYADVVEAAAIIGRQFGAKARVYPGIPGHYNEPTTCPVFLDHMSLTSMYVVDALRRRGLIT